MDYTKLMENLKWKDLWMSFNASKNPSSRKRDELRKLAVTVLQPKSSSSSKKRSSQGESNHDFMSMKRKHLLTSLSSLESGPAKSSTPSSSSRTESKRSRTVTNTSSMSSSAPPPATTDEDKMEETIEDEAHEPPLGSFTKEMSDALSYSDATAGSQRGDEKKYSPYFLYIHQGTEKRDTIPNKMWRLFSEKFNELLVEDTLKDQPTPDILWMAHAKGVGLIMPTDQRSQQLAKEAVSRIKVADISFRAWAPGDKGKYDLISIRLPQQPSKIPSGKILTVI